MNALTARRVCLVPPSNGNPGIVPPWLTSPLLPLPGPLLPPGATPRPAPRFASASQEEAGGAPGA